MARKSNQLIVPVEPSVKRAVKKEAAAEGVTVAEFIRRLIAARISSPAVEGDA